MDDFQNTAQLQVICDMMRYMLDNLPSSYSIFILSRANFDVFTEKLKLEKKVLEIGTDDFAFNNAEMENLMVSMGQTATDRKLTDVIVKSLKDNNLVIYYDAASVLVYIYMCSNNMKGLLEITADIPKHLQNVPPELKNTLAILDMCGS